MKYYFDSIPNRRKTNSSKWNKYPVDTLPLWVADMDFPAPPQIQDALFKHVERGVLGYEDPSRALREIIAARMKKLYDWDVNPDWLVYTAGVNNGYNIAARMLCTPRRGYMIQTPVYNEFLDTERKAHIRQNTARLEKKVEGNRISYEVDFDAFEREAKKSAMFLLCHPHNPVGRIHSRDELKRMAKICMENDVTIVSDEIHSELLLGNSVFTPMAKLSREIEKRTITLVAASKAFNVAGLACAFAIIPDAKLRAKFIEVADGMSFEVSTLGLIAAQTAYSGKADAWLRALRGYLTQNRDFIIDYVNQHIPGMRFTRPDATYLMWLDCSELQLKTSPFEFFLKEARVALSDGGRFGKGNEKFVRLNFGTSRSLLAGALERMRKSLS